MENLMRIQTEHGQEAAFVFNRNNGPAWHRLGIPFEGPLVWPEALKRAQGDFTVVEEPLYDKQGEVSTTHKQLVRYDDKGERHVLASVGVHYFPLQNERFFGMLDEVGRPAGMEWDTLGILGEGAIAFGCLKPKLLIPLLNGEKLECYLTGLNGHNGQVMVEFYLSGIRTQCQNTAFATRENNYSRWRGRHTPGLEQRLQEIREALGIDIAQISRYQAQCDKLIELPTDAAVVKTWLETLWPLDGVEHVPTAKLRAKNRDLVTELALHGRGNDGKALWSWYNGFTEWADGYKPVRLAQALSLETSSAQADRVAGMLDGDARLFAERRMVSGLKGAANASREAARVGLLECAGIDVAALNEHAMAMAAKAQ